MQRKSGLYFKQGEAAAFLLKRARALGFQATRPAHLAELGLLEGTKENARRYLAGRFPITDEHARHIREKLKISAEDWTRITEQRGDEITAEMAEGVRTWLRLVRQRGLGEAVTFAPPQVGVENLPDFCVPARVVTEEEWHSLMASRRRAEERSPAAEQLIARRAAGVLLNGWLERAHRKVVLAGHPGEGKTTALWLYVDALCQKWIEALAVGSLSRAQRGMRIPLVLPLRVLSGESGGDRSLPELAVDYLLGLARLDAVFRVQVEEWLWRRVRNGSFILLLDALDECPDQRLPWLRSELDRLGEVPVILTTRYHAEPRSVLRQFTELRMVPLRWWIIDEFLNRYFAAHRSGTRLANEIRRTLRQTPGLRLLAQNPLLLGAMCSLKAEDQAAVLPTSRSGLLHAALRAMLSRGDARRQATREPVGLGRESHGLGRPRILRDEAKIEILAEVAWQYQRERPEPMPEVALLQLLDRQRERIKESPPESAECLLAELLQDGVLVRQGSGPYTFMLRRFQEYCLARRLAQMADGEAASRFQGLIRGRARVWGRAREWTDFRPLNQPGWVEVWPLVAGCMKGNGALIEALATEWETAEDLVDSRLRLLVAALGEFLEANREQRLVCERWTPLANQVADATLELVRRESPVNGLPQSWRPTLAQLPAGLVAPKLGQRIRTGATTEEANNFVLSLGELGSPETCQQLELLIADGTAHEVLRANAAIGLGLVGDAPSRDVLLHWLGRSQTGLKYLLYGCIAGLAFVADQPARRALADLLKSRTTDPDARLQCIAQCERLFGPEIEEELLVFIEGCGRDVKRGVNSGGWNAAELNVTMANCAQILGRIGGPGCARRLLGLLSLPVASDTRMELCNAVAEIGDECGRESLRKLAVSTEADREMSISAALALVKAGDDEMLVKLLTAASSESCPEHLRAATVKACRDGPASAVIAFLADRLRHDPAPRIRLAAAESLALRTDAAATAALRQGMQGEPPEEVRLECARGLALNGEPDALDVLVNVATDAKQDVRRRADAIQALSQLEAAAARATLRAIFEDAAEHAPMRSRAADALQDLQRQRGWRPLCSGGWESP